MKEETEWMQGLLPKHYICEPRENGVRCYSEIGIADDKGRDDHWYYIEMAIKQKFGERFMEIYHQTCTNHKKFTVFIKPTVPTKDLTNNQ